MTAETNGELINENVQLSDGGTYQCRDWNTLCDLQVSDEICLSLRNHNILFNLVQLLLIVDTKSKRTGHTSENNI